MLAENSRYYGLPTVAYEAPDGSKIVHLPRRLLPAVESMEVVGWHAPTEDERLDHIAARYLDDPELFWRLCDANRAMHPRELTTGGRRWLAIPLPQ